MKTKMSFFLAIILILSACGDKTNEKAPEIGLESTVNVAAQYLDDIFMNALGSLEIIAKTPEAKTGDWEGIKCYLKELKTKTPGVYFYVLPDGNYYRVTQDYTNLNLANRPYFAPLFSGDAVMGYPIYGRSSGKKSALMATPVLVDNKVVGALGSALFLEDLHHRFNSELALPTNYLWFVLDAQGNTILDKDKDFIFMNPLTEGSPSLRAAINEMLKNDSGSMQYRLDGMRYAQYKKLPNMNWWLVIARNEGKVAPAPEHLTLSLDKFVPELKQSINNIDVSLSTCIKEADNNLKNESEIRELLQVLTEENPDIVEAGFVTKKGILAYIEPAAYRNFENEDISKQKHVIALRKDPIPVFSSGFMSVEGFLCVDLAHPVFDGRGELLGSVSVLIRPELLIDPLLEKSQIPEDYELWIMQTDGLMIYDKDPEEIGKMLFSDPAYAKYESLLDLGKKIAAEPEGEGSYIFLAYGSTEKTIKEVIWKTIRIQDREWRVVLGHKPYKK